MAAKTDKRCSVAFRVAEARSAAILGPGHVHVAEGVQPYDGLIVMPKALTET